MYQVVGDRAFFNGPSSSSSSGEGVGEVIGRMVAVKPVVVVGRPDCCMTHVVTRLLQGHGVNPAVCEVSGEVDDAALMEELGGGETADSHGSGAVMFPAVFIGGKLVGGLDRLMAVHISGDLVPILKEAGALWL